MVISNIKVLEGPPIDDWTLTSSKCEHFLPAVLRSVFFLTEFYYMIPILFFFFFEMIEVKKTTGESGGDISTRPSTVSKTRTSYQTKQSLVYSQFYVAYQMELHGPGTSWLST